MKRALLVSRPTGWRMRLRQPTINKWALAVSLTLTLILANQQQLNCDQQVNNNSEHEFNSSIIESTESGSNLQAQQTTNSPTTTTTSTTAIPQTTTTTTTTTNAPADSTTTTNQTLTLTKLESNFMQAEYKQRPNPASSTDSSAKLNYDTQHEQQVFGANSSAPLSSLFASRSESLLTGQTNSSKLDVVGSTNSTTTTTTSLQVDSKQQAFTDQLDLFHAHSLEAQAADARAEFLIAPQATVNDDNQAPQQATPTQHDSDASPTTLDLESASTSTSTSIISRHGRASSQQQRGQQHASSLVSTYTPPASSRLSSYTPMLLQNSRAHDANFDKKVAEPAEQLKQQQQELTALERHQQSIKPNEAYEPIVVCYLGSWSVYRPSLAKFTPENINPYLCTHIIYAFAGLSSRYELKPFDSYNDITQGGYRKFTSLKEYNKQLKTLIAVGGWNEGSAR